MAHTYDAINTKVNRIRSDLYEEAGKNPTSNNDDSKVTDEEVVLTSDADIETFFSNIAVSEDAVEDENFINSDRIYRSAFDGDLSFIEKGNGIYLVKNSDGSLGFTNETGKNAYFGTTNAEESKDTSKTPNKTEKVKKDVAEEDTSPVKDSNLIYDNWDTNYKYGTEKSPEMIRKENIRVATEMAQSDSGSYAQAMRKQDVYYNKDDKAYYDNWDKSFEYPNYDNSLKLEMNENGLYNVYVGKNLVATMSDEEISKYGLLGSNTGVSDYKSGGNLEDAREILIDDNGNAYIEVTLDENTSTLKELAKKFGISRGSIYEYNDSITDLSKHGIGSTIRIPMDSNYIKELDEAHEERERIASITRLHEFLGDNPVGDLVSTYKSGELSKIVDGASLYDYYDKDYVKGLIKDVKRNYSGRDAAVKSVLVMLTLSKDKGKKLDYDWGGGHHSGSVTLKEVAEGVDCSGFVSWAVNQGSKDAFESRTTVGLAQVGKTISVENVKPGDYLVRSGHHVVFVVENNGDGLVVAEAQSSANGVKISSLTYNEARKYTAKDMSSYYE